LLEAIALAALIATFAMVFEHWQRLPVFARRGSGGSYSVMVLLNAGVYLLLTFASRYQQLMAALLWIVLHTPLGRLRTAGREYLAVFLVAMLAPTLIYVRRLSRFRK
jgi:hypothetical protein